MYWYSQVRNIWGLLSTSHAPITANKNLWNKPYFCLGLLSNLAYIMIPVDARSTILGIFYPFSPSLYGILLVTLDDCWLKQSFGKCDVFWTPSETGCLITSETDAPSLTGLSGVTLSTLVGVLVGYSSRSGVNQVPLS